MSIVHVLMSLIALAFGVVVGLTEASFWNGFIAYVVSAIILLLLGGWWFTPQLRLRQEDEDY